MCRISILFVLTLFIALIAAFLILENSKDYEVGVEGEEYRAGEVELRATELEGEAHQ